MIKNIEFYVDTFLVFVWLIFILYSRYQDKKRKKIFPDKTKMEKIFDGLFNIFLCLSILFLAKGLITNIPTGDANKSVLIYSSRSISYLLGVFLCLFSISLHTYINFFEKSFPSCIAVKNNQPLSGLYKYVRHPSYYIFFSITFGTALCLYNFLLFLLACIINIYLYFVYIEEENNIKKTNSTYGDYLKRTKRFLPTFSRQKTIH